MRIIAALLSLFLLHSTRAQELHPMPNEKPMSAKELARFLGPVPSDAIAWTRSDGIDSESYYGRANPPLVGYVAFHVGNAVGLWSSEPNGTIIEDKKITIVEGKLGSYAVQWHREVTTDGSIKQVALIETDPWGKRKLSIQIQAKRQQDIEELVKVITRLPIFSKSPP